MSLIQYTSSFLENQYVYSVNKIIFICVAMPKGYRNIRQFLFQMPPLLSIHLVALGKVATHLLLPSICNMGVIWTFPMRMGKDY